MAYDLIAYDLATATNMSKGEIEDTLRGSKSNQLAARFLEAMNSSETYNYVIVGDSTRDRPPNDSMQYYADQLSKIGWVVTDSAQAGMSTIEWNTEVKYPSSLQACISATPNTGLNTIMEYSLGINNGATDAPAKKAEILDGINQYMAAKPDALVFLVSPVGTIEGRQFWTDIYTEIADELNLFMVDGSRLLNDVATDDEFMDDGTHPNKYGSRRFINGIFSQMLPPTCALAVDMIDEGIDGSADPVETPYETSFINANYRTTDGTLNNNNAYRALDLLPVTEAQELYITHGGNQHTAVFFDESMVFVGSETLSHRFGEYYRVTAPATARFIGINVHQGFDYNFDYTVVVRDKDMPDRFIFQKEINKNLTIALPYTINNSLDANGRKPIAGQVPTGQADGSWIWE